MSTHRHNRTKRLWRTFRMPLLIAILSLAGLIWALLVDGPTDLFASLLVGVPLLAAIFLRRGPR